MSKSPKRIEKDTLPSQSIEPSVDGFQTQSVLRALLDSAGISPRKRFGQHFLIDRNLMHKLVDAAELSQADNILEVGPGTGSLTALLAAKAGSVIAVEIDEMIAAIARHQLATFPNVTLLQTDALASKSVVNPVILNALGSPSVAKSPTKLVANLPYDIATSLIVNLLVGDLAFERFCFTVQAEVGDRFLAKHNTNDYGPVSILTQVAAVGERIARVPPQAFWPQPKVDSAMIRLATRSKHAVKDLSALSEFLRSFFQHRRKTISHTARTLPNAELVLAEMRKSRLKESARPAELTVDQWLQLFQATQ